jgi:hypothetical protein
VPTRFAWHFTISTINLSPRPPRLTSGTCYFWATHIRLEPILGATRTIKRHSNCILRWFDRRLANGLIEGITSLVQAAKAKASGYPSRRNLKAMIYLRAEGSTYNLIERARS